jgi:hypothetical protein
VRHRQRALKGPPLTLRITRDGFAALDRPAGGVEGATQVIDAAASLTTETKETSHVREPQAH